MAPRVLLLAGIVMMSLLAARARMQPHVDEQCGKYGWEVPAPPNGLQLLQVNAIIRLANI